jgi:hypothetical protein
MDDGFARGAAPVLDFLTEVSANLDPLPGFDGLLAVEAETGTGRFNETLFVVVEPFRVVGWRGAGQADMGSRACEFSRVVIHRSNVQS